MVSNKRLLDNNNNNSKNTIRFEDEFIPMDEGDLMDEFEMNYDE